MASATTVCGWPSITSSPKALNAFPTPSLWHCTSRTERKTSRLVAASISLRCGTRCGWRRTSLPLTSSPAAAITEEQIEIMRDPKRAPTAKLPRIEDAVKAGGFLCGNADDLIEHIKALEKKYPGLDRISVSLSVGVPEKVALEQLDRFAKEVMPAFKEAEAPQPMLVR